MLFLCARSIYCGKGHHRVSTSRSKETGIANNDSIGNGLNTSTVPTWQSECSKSHRRGQLVMVEGALITGGICFSYWLDFGFSFLDPNSIAWRFPIGFQIVFAVVILLFVLELPESPRWLVLKGKEEYVPSDQLAV